MMRITTKRSRQADGVLNVMKCRSTICEQKDDLSPKHLRYRGFVLVWTAVIFFALFLLVGLSLDVAKLCIVNHQMHNAADAAALAGGPYVKKNRDYARDLAVEFAGYNKADHLGVYLERNDENLAYGDIIFGRYTYNRAEGKSYFFRYDPTSVDPMPINAIAVNVSRTQDRMDAGGPISLIFGKIVNVFTANLEGSCVISDPDTYETIANPDTGVIPHRHGPYAIAVAVGGSGSGMVCLRPDKTGLSIQGTVSLTVNNITEPYVYEEGAITINSNDDDYCLYTNGTSVEVNADIINFTANDFSSTGNFVFPPEPDTYLNFGQPPMPDPLAWLNEPENKPTTNPELAAVRATDLTELYGDVFINAPIKIDDYPNPIPSGYYSGGLELDAGTEEIPIVLSSGIYILGGDGLKVGSKGYVVTEPGAFFYITGDGMVDIDGGASFYATPFKDGVMYDGLYDNIIIAQDKDTLTCADINGGPGFNLEGAMYFPQEVEQKGPHDPAGYALSLGGSGAAFNNQIITWSLYVYGTGDVLVNYDGRNPAPISKAYLVE